MGRDKNFRESRMNVISLLAICVKHEIRDWQFSPFIVILSEKHANFSVISCAIAEITWIRHEQEFTT